MAEYEVLQRLATYFTAHKVPVQFGDWYRVKFVKGVPILFLPPLETYARYGDLAVPMLAHECAHIIFEGAFGKVAEQMGVRESLKILQEIQDAKFRTFLERWLVECRVECMFCRWYTGFDRQFAKMLVHFFWGHLTDCSDMVLCRNTDFAMYFLRFVFSPFYSKEDRINLANILENPKNNSFTLGSERSFRRLDVQIKLDERSRTLLASALREWDEVLFDPPAWVELGGKVYEALGGVTPILKSSGEGEEEVSSSEGSFNRLDFLANRLLWERRELGKHSLMADKTMEYLVTDAKETDLWPHLTDRLRQKALELSFRIRRYLQSWTYVEEVADQEEGYFDLEAIPKLVTGGDNRLFYVERRTVFLGGEDVAVHVLADFSASMYGHHHRLAEWLSVLAWALDMVGVKYSIAGFSGREYIWFKRFNARWSTRVAGAIYETEPCSTTPAHLALPVSADALLGVRAQRKIMFFLTDGVPMHPGKTKVELDRLKKKGVEIVPVFFFTDAPETIRDMFPNLHVEIVTSFEQFAEHVIGELAKRILSSKRVGVYS